MFNKIVRKKKCKSVIDRAEKTRNYSNGIIINANSSAVHKKDDF